MLAGFVAFGADDEWTKVRSLKTGAELRVYKKGSTQPVSAQMDELTDENLVVIVKKTQTAIPKDQIDSYRRTAPQRRRDERDYYQADRRCRREGKYLHFHWIQFLGKAELRDSLPAAAWRAQEVSDGSQLNTCEQQDLCTPVPYRRLLRSHR
jgi:hypothetical protein